MKNHSLFGYGHRIFCYVLVGCTLSNTRSAFAHSPLGIAAINNVFLQRQVTGAVTDASGPLAGVSVAVKGTATMTLTDAEGRYVINASKGDVLVFTFLGYANQELTANGSIVNATLISNVQTLQEVTVNAGYYSVKESERTGNIARITADDIKNQPVANVLATMQGRMAGVSITQNTGTPGGGFEIQIRGQNSLRADGNRPMYIIDGVPYDSESLTDGFTSGVLAGKPSPLNSIPPEQIASIEVLKDADATAIYGSRGENGVVLITTKKAKGGKTAFSARFTRGAGRATRFMKLMNTQQYLAMRREAFANDGITEYPEYAYDVNGTWDQNRYTDWQQTLLGGMAEFSTVNTSIGGGSEHTSFLISGGFSEQSTVFEGNFKYKTGNVKASLSHESADSKIKLAFAAGLTRQDNNLPGTDFTTEAIGLAPNAPALYDAGGNLNWENSTFNNPLRNILGTYVSNTDDLLSNLKLAYAIAEGWEASVGLGYTATELTERNLNPSTMYMPAMGIGPEGSYIGVTRASRNSWIIEPQLRWQKEYKRHRIDILGGGTFQSQQGESLVQLGVGFSSNSLIGNLAAASQTITMGSDKSEYRYQAFFARANYVFNNKLILNLTGRRDGSSRFGPGRQFANFGAIGLAWLFHKEKLFSDQSLLSFGKLRGSYGLTGSDQIGNYQYRDTYSSSGTSYNGMVGLQPSRLYNPNFAWETNEKLEAGLELGLFKDKIMLTIAYYRNLSANQLTGIPLPGTTGFQTVQANLDATVRNTGLECTFRTANIESADFSWTTSFNLTFSKNRLISFPGLEGSTYAEKYQLGESLNIQKLYHYEGINPQTGLYQFTDANGDGTVNYLDKTAVANFSPKYYGGFQNEFRYKKLRLDFLFQFVKQQNRDFSRSMGFGGDMRNQATAVLDHTILGGATGSTQIYTAGFNSDAVMASAKYGASDAIVGDASFIRLKNVSIVWEMPVQKTTGVACQLTVQAQNLLTWTRFKGGDPEFTNGGYLPPMRTITAGIGLSF
ncbi:SusC/RagA family TonB-linked outer membrane protein [Flavobacterium qiangtangense]|uniref:SusC/RagA family TonB-linked outer membrane protein n=1 Tax=Flavobacterium qiangtangense TaxID=1442595 RepID=A0ABW1PLN0_9FLAO